MVLLNRLVTRLYRPEVVALRIMRKFSQKLARFVAYTPQGETAGNGIMRKPFSEVNSVLNRVMSKLGLDQRLREHTFLTMWPTFVAGAIAERSRPLFIDAERNLVVSVADAATGQELSMSKPRVLAKLSPIARSLGIEIRGIRLDLKHYHSTTTGVTHPLASDERLLAPSEEDLAAVSLDDGDRQEISKLAEELVSRTEDARIRGRMVRLFERELRIRSWRLANGYPLCQHCANPVEHLHKKSTPGSDQTAALVCIACMYAD